MGRKQWIVAVAGLTATMTALAGCKSLQTSSEPKHTWEIHVDADDSIAGKSVEVHLIGVETTDEARWNSISITEYWRPGTGSWESELRDALIKDNSVKILRFGPGKDTSQVYTDGSKDSKDPWNQWVARAQGRPLSLVVLADLPSYSWPPDNDPRRVILPLDPKRWEGRPRTIRIAVQSSGLKELTKPKPEQPKKRFLLF